MTSFTRSGARGSSIRSRQRLRTFTDDQLTPWQAEKLRRYFEDPTARQREPRPRIPPGSPIGSLDACAVGY